MTDEELIARLRTGEDLHVLAANRIEALVKERDMAAEGWAEATRLIGAARQQYSEEKARAERLEAALRGLMMHEPDHPDTLWQEARAALKGEDHE